ncbi:hypothetical protein [Actimicrobium antarcticum]|uniref:Uncharacterized protein n=1 Tax=Actimicrobium antarcticum TaxID=1051899 RepID=A0ABP7T1F9_9BURK
MKKLIALLFGLTLAGMASAKLPAPSDEAKAKTAETKAKAAWSDKVSAYKLCLVQDKTAAYYLKAKSPATKPMEGLPACADPGPYVAAPVAAVAVAPAAAPAVAAAVAPAAPAAKEPVKK